MLVLDGTDSSSAAPKLASLSVLPDGEFEVGDAQIADAAVKASAGQCGELDLGDVGLGAVFGGEVDLLALGQSGRPLRIRRPRIARQYRVNVTGRYICEGITMSCLAEKVGPATGPQPANQTHRNSVATRYSVSATALSRPRTRAPFHFVGTFP